MEEICAVGGRAHLAEPAETSARRGNKKLAKSDRADARHLRELLMIDRLPESWIAPAHLLDLRAQVRLRHTLADQRGEWQQRIQATLYHHGLPQRRQDKALRAYARRQPGCRALMAHWRRWARSTGRARGASSTCPPTRRG